MKLLFISSAVFILSMLSCGTKTTQGESTNSDTLKTSETAKANNSLQNELSAYIISPPDTNYTGEYLDKYPNGNTKFKGTFRFGKRHGQWMAFYANGVLWSECFYNNGLKHGSNTVYYENGKMRYNGYFNNEKRDSLWHFYDEFGVELKQVRFKNDEEISSN